ncbi:uncharacterized protein PHALS_02564 [Plasmopara halstedii]|uniref:Uncharacterized protein n=1 Tax=Plasmopara halstedii TaxID=4781 RepID=A0A0P1AXT7_PLAHL|nr:uncharacterized protein PHALS_02564 [Plasmopara halstedii]CEG46144.1 hypothetical protein PHALS_02564 [Plasmopara halstedii]|eukprot:XP_024582513.1 hypothetical protein PHALS_02564 [Plasmopara halstedii]
MRWHAMSKWWKQSCTWWHHVKWSVTYEALSVGDKYELLLQQQIWLHTDRQLQYMKPTKSPQAGTNCRPIGMIPEPDRGFRKHVAQRFRLRFPESVHPGCDVEKTLQGAYASGDTRVSDSYTSTWRGRAEVITLWCCYLDSVVHHPQYSQKIPA